MEEKNWHLINEIKNTYPCIATIGLDCCKVNEREYGWISDNYFGYCKVVKLLYHPITKLKEKIYDESISAVFNWTLNICKNS